MALVFVLVLALIFVFILVFVFVVVSARSAGHCADRVGFRVPLLLLL